MAYNGTPEYTADDVTNATIDGVTKFIIVIVGFASLIALTVLAIWARKRVPKM